MGGAVALRHAVFAALVLLALVGIQPSVPALAHGGHDHEEPVVANALGPSAAPRMTIQSEDLELVAIAHGRVLTIYLDRFADNQPVADARIDIESNGETIQATPAGDGVYQASADWIATPGGYDLVFTIMTPEISDLLAGRLTIPEPSAAPATLGMPAAVAPIAPAISLGAAFLLGMATMWGLIAARRIEWAAVVKGLGAQAANALSKSDAALARWLSTGRGAASTLQRSIARARTRANVRIHELRGQLRGWAAALGQAPMPALQFVRRKVRRGPGATSLTLLTFGFVLAALVLILIGRAGFAHAASQTDEAAPARPAMAGANTGEPVVGPRRLLDGTVFVPKSAQRLLEVQTVVTKISDAARSLRIAGQVIADPGTSGQVHSSIKGRVVPANDVWPRVGQTVKSGEVLAWVVPVINPIDRGIIFQQLAQIDQEIGLAQGRLEKLTGASNATAREIDDARSDLANLSKRRASIALVLKDRDTLRAPLLAPSDGVIAASFAVAGQLVDEQQKLFEVVDPKRLWVEAYAYDITALGDITAADATSSIGKTYKLKFVSRGPQLQKQTIPLYFHVENPDGTLSVGSLVSVLVQAAGRRQGVILPRAAVVKDSSGQSIVWNHAGAETFVPLPVRIDPIDGENVLVLAGVKPDTRIVVNSAYLLSEIR